MNKSKILQQALSSESFISPETTSILTPTSIKEAKDLWNQMISYSNSKNLTTAQQELLSELRLLSLNFLENHQPLESLQQRYLRVAKSFIDVKNYKKALKSLEKVQISSNSTATLKLNYFFLRGQVEFYQDEDFFASFQETSKLCLQLLNEKFRIARFLYVEICSKLLQSKKLSVLCRATKLVLEICKDSTCERLKEVYSEAMMLHIESLIETGNFEGAQYCLEMFGKNSDSLLLSFKKAVYSNSNNEMSLLERELIDYLSLEQLRKAVDFMIIKGKNIETCRILKHITNKYQDFLLYFTWFKLLFALDMVEMLDSSLEYLDMNFVLGHLKPFKHPEYLKLLWNYIQELFCKAKHSQVLSIVSEFFLPFADKPEVKSAFSLMAQSLIHLNRIEESLEVLRQFNQIFNSEINENQSEINAIHCICLIKLQTFDEHFDDLLQSLDFQNLAKVLQELNKENLEKFEDVLTRFSQKLLENANHQDDKARLLVWLLENDKDLKRLHFYIDYAKVLKTLDYAENFAFRIWNLSIETPDLHDRVNFMVSAVEFLEKLQDFSGKSVEIIKNTCKFALFHSFSRHYEHLYSVFKTIPKDLKNSEYFLILFEFSLIFNELEPYFFSNSLENLQKMAKVCKKHNKFDVCRECLEKIIQIRPDHESLLEVLKICKDSDELEHYLKVAEKFYLSCPVTFEIEWFIAFCWNNAVSCSDILRNPVSILFLRLALTICQAHGLALTEKVEKLLNRLK